MNRKTKAKIIDDLKTVLDARSIKDSQLIAEKLYKWVVEPAIVKAIKTLMKEKPQ